MAKNNIITADGDFPTEEENPKFWDTLKGDGFKSAVNFLVLNEARKSNPSALSDIQCRSQLAKIFAYVGLLDLPVALSQPKEEDTNQDEL